MEDGRWTYEWEMMDGWRRMGDDGQMDGRWKDGQELDRWGVDGWGTLLGKP